ncbi:DNA-binding transcriptional regulator, MerR family [Fulvimarina manganoxydans]|uniref:DNA-binding transcriptional regulator, MerR family n=2 Tax=Fulvimarina manganoxydans TaxID=937218 RepID=A0A1W2E059_9HYPH|nr:DNA-binding transcriptional regulator, MerR family [Fulvimarina manganoxydans]
MDVRGARKSGMLKIGEVAALLRTTPRTLLYYEEQGIIRPAKTSGGTRMFSDMDIRRFAVAYELAGLGVSIRAIRELTAVVETETSPQEAARKLSVMLDGLQDDIRARVKQLERISGDIAEAHRWLEEVGEGENAGVSDGLTIGEAEAATRPILSLIVHQPGAIEDMGKETNSRD